MKVEMSSQVVRRPSNQCWIYFHGSTDAHDSPGFVRLEEHGVNVIYLIMSLRWIAGARRVCRRIQGDIECLRTYPDTIVWAGNSWGAEQMHRYAVYAQQHGFADLIGPHCLVHYAGRFRGHVAKDVPCLCYLGEKGMVLDEPIQAMVRGTEETAAAYGTKVIRLPGAHRWNAECNERILNDVQEVLA